MVELALVLPVLLLLALIALDFGRLFLGYIALNNMVRVGADYAANHPDAWANGNAGQLQEYRDLIISNGNAINCDLQPADPAPPVFDGTRQPGERVSVTMQCEFALITPLISAVVGQSRPDGTFVVPMTASNSYPVSTGCLADCTAGPPAVPPPPANNCRSVPAMSGLSVLAARNAWIAAGFLETNFEPATDPDRDWRQVDVPTITEPTNDDNCASGTRYVFAEVAVSLVPLVDPPPTATCVYIPNLEGMTVAQARDTWELLGLGTDFLPVNRDTDIVTAQFTTPESNIADCVEPVLPVEVAWTAPPAPPPPPPCLVPGFANTSSLDAADTWTGNGFTGTLTLKNLDKLPYTIKSQSLVGGSYISCTSPIVLSNTGSTN